MLAGFAFTVTLLTFASSQSPRDAAAPLAPRSGTASVSGVIVTDDADSRPVRRARVAIMDSDRRHGATVITDDAGRFTFRNVPAGRYSVMAVKNAWLMASYGATRPTRPGTPIALAEGQHVDQLTIRMARGAVITGTVTDEAGRPIPRISVTPLRYMFVNGARSLAPAGQGSQADDRGVYRIYGLVPGQYLIAARYQLGVSSPMTGSEIRATTEADIERALAQRRSGIGATRTAGGHDEATGTVAYAPTFYPGTAAPSQAATITVAAGEERSGIDFSVGLVPTARIEGTVVGADGAPAANGTVNLISSEAGIPGFGFESFRVGRTNAEGRFSFAGMPPGKYTIVSRATPSRIGAGEDEGSPRVAPPVPPTRMSEPVTPTLFAATDVILDGQSVSGLTMVLQPGLTVSGRLHFTGTLPKPDMSRMRVQLSPITMPGQVNLGVPPAVVSADGTFTIAGVAPGTYRFSSLVPGSRPDGGWMLVSANVNGRDMLDFPLELRESVQDVVLMFSDRMSQLSGRLQDPSGRPAPDYFIVLFAADRAHWVSQSRRIRAVRPGADGSFNIRGLPAGEYLVSAVTDIEPGEWFDPSVLQQLSSASLKITLQNGEEKVQDIQVPAAR